MSRAVYEFPSAAYAGATSLVVGSVRSEGNASATVIVTQTAATLVDSNQVTVSLTPHDPQTGAAITVLGEGIDGGSVAFLPTSSVLPAAFEVPAMELHSTDYVVQVDMNAQPADAQVTLAITVILED